MVGNQSHGERASCRRIQLQQRTKGTKEAKQKEKWDQKSAKSQTMKSSYIGFFHTWRAHVSKQLQCWAAVFVCPGLRCGVSCLRRERSEVKPKENSSWPSAQWILLQSDTTCVFFPARSASAIILLNPPLSPAWILKSVCCIHAPIHWHLPSAEAPLFPETGGLKPSKHWNAV